MASLIVAVHGGQLKAADQKTTLDQLTKDLIIVTTNPTRRPEVISLIEKLDSGTMTSAEEELLHVILKETIKTLEEKSKPLLTSGY